MAHAKKKKNKKRLAFGGAPLDQGRDAQIEQGLTGAAGAMGPWWGALAKGGSALSKELGGSGTNSTENVAGQVADPFNQFKSIGAGAWEELIPGYGHIAFNKRRKSEAAAAANQQSALNQIDMMSYKYGGILKKKLGLIHGGSLETISPDAVEVVADNPGQTDSVELSEAYVDNNEIIDNKNRVFSDDLTTPAGRTIAKEAKRLEKMKSTNGRFAASNERIESKLNELFDYQEQARMAAESTGNKNINYNAFSAKVAGEERAKDTGFMNEGYELLHGQVVKKKLGYAKGGKMKKKLDNGGPFSEKDLYDTTGGTQVDLVNGMPENTQWIGQQSTMPDFSGYSWNNNPSSTKKFDWNKAGAAAATFGSNVLNQYLISRLAGPSQPRGEQQVRLPRISANAQLGEINSGFRGAQEVANRNIAQSSNLISATGSLLAKKLNAGNQAIDAVNRINTSIQADETGMNVGINARNVGRNNQWRDNVTEFRNKKLQLTSQNAANISEKALMMGREKNLKDKDMLQLQLLQQAYGDSGVYDRAMKAMLDEYLTKKGMRRR